MGTMVAKTIIDAKGDLIAGSAADTALRLAVGSNGETLVADSAATTGLRYSATPSASNPVLNSAFQVAQRGTSFSFAASTSATYTLDRWQTYTGASQACTISRQATGDTTNLPFIQYAARYQRNSGQTGTSGLFFAQTIESVNSIPFAGKTVTMSFYARAGANFSATANVLVPYLISGTGTDQNYISGFTGAVAVSTASSTLTTTWQRFSISGTVATTATQLATVFNFNPQGTAGAADYFDVTGVQIDIGSVALPFRTYAATIQGELSACLRYYWRTTANVQYLGTGTAKSATVADFVIQYPQTMRVAPTMAANTGTTYFGFDTAAALTGDTTIGNFYDPSNIRTLARITTSGLTTGQGGIGQTRNASAYVEASAEL
jgi:hypothetical protein